MMIFLDTLNYKLSYTECTRKNNHDKLLLTSLADQVEIRQREAKLGRKGGGWKTFNSVEMWK